MANTKKEGKENELNNRGRINYDAITAFFLDSITKDISDCVSKEFDKWKYANRTNYRNKPKDLPGVHRDYFKWITGLTDECKYGSMKKLYPGAYKLTKSTGFISWDDYNPNLFPGHETVWIDGLDTVDDIEKFGGLSLLKSMASLDPFTVDTKYSLTDVFVRPRFIIVTTNTPMEELCKKWGERQQIPYYNKIYTEGFQMRFTFYTADEWLIENNLYPNPSKK